MRWRALASVMAARGTIPGIQLTTTWEGYEGVKAFRSKSSWEAIARSRRIAAEVSPGRLRTLFDSLREGTEMAAEAGFRHVQLHGAHGYLFCLLLDARFYDGADDCRGLVEAWSADSRSLALKTSLRISLETGDPRFDRDGTKQFQDRVSALSVDFVDVSSGHYNIDKRLIYPSVPGVLQERWRQTASLAARRPRTQFILSGRAMEAVEGFPRNVHLGLCRDLIANPHFLSGGSPGCRNAGKCHY